MLADRMRMAASGRKKALYYKGVYGEVPDSKMRVTDYSDRVSMDGKKAGTTSDPDWLEGGLGWLPTKLNVATQLKINVLSKGSGTLTVRLINSSPYAVVKEYTLSVGLNTFNISAYAASSDKLYIRWYVDTQTTQYCSLDLVEIS